MHEKLCCHLVTSDIMFLFIGQIFVGIETGTCYIIMRIDFNDTFDASIVFYRLFLSPSFYIVENKYKFHHGSMDDLTAFNEAALVWADGRTKQRLQFQNRDAISTVETYENNSLS